MEHKAFPAVSYKASGDGDRVRTGIAAVFGNVDSYKDITHPGAFTKTLSEGRSRWVHLWNHNAMEPPIATVLDIREVGKGELPEEILKYAPDATGGLLVKREYLKTPRAEEVLAGIDAGAITEMSFAYDIVKSDYSETKGDQQIRNLREVALYDTSDVNWGANPATVASAKNGLIKMPLGLLLQHLQLHANDEKAGRRNNHVDQTLINGLHDIAMHLGCDTCKGLTDEETPKSEPAAAGFDTTALVANRLKLQHAKLELLTQR